MSFLPGKHYLHVGFNPSLFAECANPKLHLRLRLQFGATGCHSGAATNTETIPLSIAQSNSCAFAKPITNSNPNTKSDSFPNS